jgi:UPF0716 protein FxsA
MLWFVVLVLWPLAELFVIIKISEAIGFLWMLLLLVLSWPIGSRIIRLEGRAALRRLRDALAQGREPTNEVINGALVLFGGLLLLVPGFISDAVGLLLLLRPTRSLARRGVARNHRSTWLGRAVSFVTRSAPRGRGGPGAPGAGDRGYDADTTAVDIDEPQLGR